MMCGDFRSVAVLARCSQHMFGMAFFRILVEIGRDVVQFFVSGATRVQELKETCCESVGHGNVEMSWLWKDGVQLQTGFAAGL